MTKACLRVMVEGPRDPAANMAVDETLLRAVAAGARGPVVRFYRWDPPSLSFGYAQDVARLVDPAVAAASGIGLVRRMTGGRAVFHGDEWTFSLVVPLTWFDRELAWAHAQGMSRRKGEESSTLAAGTSWPSTAPPAPAEGTAHASGGASQRGGSPLEEEPPFLVRFRALVAPFVTALREAGLDARFATDREIRRHRSDGAASSPGGGVHCYQAAAGHSIYVGDRKLVGAAGVVRDGVMAVHGSLPIRFVDLPVGIWRDPAAGRAWQGLHVAWLCDLLSAPDREALPHRLARSWAATWGLDCLADRLSEPEEQCAGRLASLRYARLDWKIAEPGWAEQEALLRAIGPF